MDRDCFELYLQYEKEVAEEKQKIIKRFLGVVKSSTETYIQSKVY